MNYKQSTKESRSKDWFNFIEAASKRHAPVDKALKEHFDTIKDHVVKTGSLAGLDKTHIKAELTAKLNPALRTVAHSAGQERLDDLYSEGLLKEKLLILPSKGIEELIGSRLALLSDTVDTTWDRVQAVLDANPENLAEEIESSLFDQRGLINTTESTALNNAGDLEGAEQSDVSLLKIWVSQQDANVRDSHTQAEDKYQDGIPLDQDFEVGDDTMSEPGEGAQLSRTYSLEPHLQTSSQ